MAMNLVEIENLVKNENEKEHKKLELPKKTDPNILLAQRKLEESLGLAVKIVNKKNNSGKITIEYSDAGQFEMISSLLITKRKLPLKDKG